MSTQRTTENSQKAARAAEAARASALGDEQPPRGELQAEQVSSAGAGDENINLAATASAAAGDAPISVDPVAEDDGGDAKSGGGHDVANGVTGADATATLTLDSTLSQQNDAARATSTSNDDITSLLRALVLSQESTAAAVRALAQSTESLLAASAKREQDTLLALQSCVTEMAATVTAGVGRNGDFGREVLTSKAERLVTPLLTRLEELRDGKKANGDAWTTFWYTLIRTLRGGNGFTFSAAQVFDTLSRATKSVHEWAGLYDTWAARQVKSKVPSADALWTLAESLAETPTCRNVSSVRFPPFPTLGGKAEDVARTVLKFVDIHGLSSDATGFLAKSQGSLVHFVKQLTTTATKLGATTHDVCAHGDQDVEELIATVRELCRRLSLVKESSPYSSFVSKSPRNATPQAATVAATTASGSRVSGLYVHATINGRLVDVSLDSGADVSFLCEHVAKTCGLAIEPASPSDGACTANGEPLHVIGVTRFFVAIGGGVLLIERGRVVRGCAIDVGVGVRQLWRPDSAERSVNITSGLGGPWVTVGNGKRVRGLFAGDASRRRSLPLRAASSSPSRVACVAQGQPLDDGSLLLFGDATDRSDEPNVDIAFVATNVGDTVQVVELQGALGATLASLTPQPLHGAAPGAPRPSAPPSDAWLDRLVRAVLSDTRDVTSAERDGIEHELRTNGWRYFAVDNQMADGRPLPPVAHDVVYSARIHPDVNFDRLRTPLRHYSPAEQAALDKLAAQLLEHGYARHSNSPVRSACLVVPKTDELNNVVGKRVAIDYRRVNNSMLADAHPMPRIDDTLNWLADGERYLCLDVWQAFYQVPVEDATVPLTAAHFGGNTFLEFLVMPFGLRQAPAVWQRFIDRTLEKHAQSARAFVDDIFVRLQAGDSMLSKFKLMLSVADEHGLTFKAEKTSMSSSIVKLGHLISHKSIKPDPRRLDPFRNAPVPQSKAEVRSFNSMLSIFTRHFPCRATSNPTLRSLGNKNTRFVWSKEAQAEFHTARANILKDCVALAPIDDATEVSLHTDFSVHGVGWIVCQIDADGKRRVVTAGSKSNVKAEREYGQISRHGPFAGELHALRQALRHERHFLIGRRVRWASDNNTLTYLMKGSDWPAGSNVRLQNTALEVSDFDIYAEFKSGADNAIADWLSRYSRTVRTPHAVQSPPPFETLGGTPTSAVVAPLRARGADDGDGSVGETNARRATRSRAAAQPVNNGDGARRGRGRPQKKPPINVRIDLRHLRERVSNSAAAAAGFRNVQLPPRWRVVDDVQWRRQVYLRQLCDGTLAPWLAVADGAQADDVTLGISKTLAKRIRNHRPVRAADGVVEIHVDQAVAVTRVLVPHGARQALLHAEHVHGGHAHGEATLQALARRFWWPQMATSVADYCTACVECARGRDHPRRADLGAPRLSAAHMAVGVIDLQGPMPDGNYLVTMVDVATRFQYAALTKTKHAAAVFNALKRATRPHTQWPLTLVADNGTEFYGDFATECSKRHIRFSYNAPYNPDARGAVERVHRVNLAVLAKLHAEYPSMGTAELLELAVWAVNTRPYADTKVTAYEAVYGAKAWTVTQRIAMPPATIASLVAVAVQQPTQLHRALVVGELSTDAIDALQSKREADNAYRSALQRKRFAKPRAFADGDAVWYNGAAGGDVLERRINKQGPFIVSDVRDEGRTATLQVKNARGELIVSEPKVATRFLSSFFNPRQTATARADGTPEQWLRVPHMKLPSWLTQDEHFYMPRQA